MRTLLPLSLAIFLSSCVNSNSSIDSTSEAIVNVPSTSSSIVNQEPVESLEVEEIEEIALDQYYVTSSKLNVRALPDSQEKKVGSINRGEKVGVYEFNGEWARIVPTKINQSKGEEYSNESQWVAKRFLSKNKPPKSLSHKLKTGQMLYCSSTEYGSFTLSIDLAQKKANRAFTKDGWERIYLITQHDNGQIYMVREPKG